MSGEPLDPGADGAWHFLPEFRQLVTRSSNAVLAARQADMRTAHAAESERSSLRWAAAILWAEAATEESELARALYERGRWPDALQTYLYATQYALSSGNPMRARALLDELGRVPGRPATMPDTWNRDLDLLEQSTRTAEAAWHAFQLRGHALRRAGTSNGDQRIQLETEIAQAFPGSGHCFYHLAVLRHQRGEPALALEMARHALAFLPVEPRVAILAGHLLLDAGRADESLGVLQRQLRELPAHPLHRIALALALIRHWEKSPVHRSLLALVLRLLPEEWSLTVFSPRTRIVAGLLRCVALWNTGRTEEADEHRERLRRVADTDSYQPEFLDIPIGTWNLADLVRTTSRDLSEAA